MYGKAGPEFPGVAQRPPIYWGGTTSYTSALQGAWRVKLKPGDRVDKPIPFGAEPQKAWGRVLELCRAEGTVPQ